MFSSMLVAGMEMKMASSMTSKIEKVSCLKRKVMMESPTVLW